MSFVCCAVVAAVLCIAPPVRAQEPDARFRADVEKLLDVTGAVAVGTQMATLVSNQMIDALRTRQPDIPAKAFDVVKDVLSAEFAKMFDGPDGVRGKLVDLHMKHFTHEDVLGLLDFYGTPIGRKAVAVMPVLAQEGAAVGQAWAMANIPRITGTVEQRLRAEGFIK